MSGEIRQPKISRIIKLEGIRKTISERMKFSKLNFPHAYLFILISAKQMIKLRETKNPKPSHNAILMKAAAEAIKLHPLLNSYLEGDEIKVFEDINIAIAVDTPKGLYAPVVGDVGKKSIDEIDSEIKDLAERARTNRLTLYDVTGGTFTLSNLGGFGVDLFIPIINPPQIAILGVGKINPVTNEFYVSLSFNHSVIDGAEGARFLSDLKALLEGERVLTL